MPRDLGLEEGNIALSESPHSTEETEEQQINGQFIIFTDQQVQATRRPDSIGKLHPYTSLLTPLDLESCVVLENAAFPIEQERASREKLIYRLTKCPELSLGLFCTALPDSNIPAETLMTGRLIESTRENGAVGVLLAHIIATQSFDPVVTDAAMDYPPDWDLENPTVATVGHRDGGRTICVHSLGVLPSFQSLGLGRMLMTAYMQQMSGAGIADRIALIAHEHLVGYYEKLGFVRKEGLSKAQFGGGGWIDLVFELKSLDARAKYG